MNARDVMKYGHGTVLSEAAKVSETNWNDGGVCGVWSIRDILAHLASYEFVLGDVLLSMIGDEPTPDFDNFIASGDDFNNAQVELRQMQSGAESLAEYTRAYERVVVLAARIPEQAWHEAGTLPWYGDEYSLDDLIV